MIYFFYLGRCRSHTGHHGNIFREYCGPCCCIGLTFVVICEGSIKPDGARMEVGGGGAGDVVKVNTLEEWRYRWEEKFE